MPRVPVANQVVFDRGVRHAIRMSRFSTREVNQLLHYMNGEVLPKAVRTLRARLRRAAELGGDPGGWTTTRVENIISGVNGVIGGGLRQAGAALREDLAEMGISEAAWEKAVISGAIPHGIAVDLELPPISQIKAIISSRPFQGKVLSKWWGKINATSRIAVDGAIKLGIASGDTTGQIVRRLAGTEGGKYMDGVFGGLRRNIASTTQTAISHTSSKAREALYRSNDDIIKGIQYVAALDPRTCEVCMSEDGKVYPIEQGPRPPLHWNCLRCTTIPVLKSWKELGLKDPGKIPRGTRASMNGQVPSRTTYGKWLKGQPRYIQNEALGKGKAELFRKGRISVKDFVDDKRHILSLADIKLREELGDFAMMAARLSPQETARLTGQLLRELQAIPKTGKAANNIRGKLRRLGHKGGLRGKVPTAPPVVPPEPGIPLAKPKVVPHEVMSATPEIAAKRIETTLGKHLKVSIPAEMSTSVQSQMIYGLDEVNKQLQLMLQNNAHLTKMVKDKLLKISQVRISGKRFITFPTTGQTVHAFYSSDTQVIRLGLLTARSRHGLLAATSPTAPLKFGGWQMSRSRFAGVFRHEFGHGVAQTVGMGRQYPGTSSFAEIYSKHSQAWWHKNISKYAGANVKEGFAECFCAYTHPAYGVRYRLPREIEKYFDTILKGTGGKRRPIQLAAAGTRDLGQFDVFAAALSPAEKKSLVSDLLVQLRGVPGTGKRANNIRGKLRRLGHKGGRGGAKKAAAKTKIKRPLPPVPKARVVADSKKQGDEWINKHFADKRPALTEKQVMSLKRYKGSRFREINRQLRGGKPPSGPHARRGLDESVNRWIRSIDSIFDKMPTTPEPMIVFRGCSLLPEVIREFRAKVGMTVTQKCYLSTSLRKQAARDFMRAGRHGWIPVLMHIEVPKNTRTIWSTALEKRGGYAASEEAEMIFARGTKLQIQRLRKTSTALWKEVHVYMRIVP